MKMSKHLKKECPLTIEMIAKQRATYLNEARRIFYYLDHKLKSDIVTERTILFIDKFRNQDILDQHVEVIENANHED